MQANTTAITTDTARLRALRKEAEQYVATTRPSAAMLYAPPTLDVLAEAAKLATTHGQKMGLLELVEARLNVIAQQIENLPNKPVANNS